MILENARIEPYRIVSGRFASDKSYGNNGHFVIPGHYDLRAMLYAVVSDGMGWEHVSVSVRTKTMGPVSRCPTWEEMCQVKRLFWADDEVVVQFHPAADKYVNYHPHCLHMWKPIGCDMPTPPPALVGPA